MAPLEKRGFDGCDITVRCDEQALVRVELRREQMPRAVVFEAPLSEVLTQQLREPLDEMGSFFLAHRSPGDELRVVLDREHLVFDPGEKWNLKVQPDLAESLASGRVLLEVQLRRVGEEKPSWQSSERLDQAAALGEGVDFEIECPAVEGAYRLSVTARPEEGFATRFVPGQQAKLIATREVEFVVIDPEAKLPTLVDQWLSVLTIDPANPSWWQRLPAWAQVSRLRGRNQGAIGNVRPVVRPMAKGKLVELPSAVKGSEPSWQAYTLPVREPGKAHLVEIEYPLAARQHLAISLLEPDASGRVTTSHRDVGMYSEGLSDAGDGEVGVHRFVFWPRTRSPQLLLVNRHPEAAGQYGKINLLRQDDSLAGLTERPAASGGERMVAGYLAKPLLPGNFGAAEVLDPGSGLSVQGWSTFLEGARRLAQTLRLGGRNTVMLSVAADGSGLYPSRIISPSPRYDTGLLAASGQDPVRKDVLEMLLRVFDREGIRVVPTVQLAAPLPRLEGLRVGADSQTTESQVTGISCVGGDGRSWLASHSSEEGLAPFYNPLNDRVQAEVVEMVGELASRYGKHASFAGVGLQVSGMGYGLMPGLGWGLDDRTVAEFSQATGIAVPGEGSERFRQRAEVLLGEHREAWKAWRIEKLTQLYAKMGEQVAAERRDLRLILATEDLFGGAELQSRVREAVSGPTRLREILREHALDLAFLEAEPNVTVLAAHRLGAADRLQERAVDLRANSAAAQGSLLPLKRRSAELFHHGATRFRLPSFDAQSPFGAEKTYLTVGDQSHPVGVNQRRHLVTALAKDDLFMLVEGGESLPLVADLHTKEILQAIEELPGRSAEVREQQAQPVVMRVYRSEGATTVVLINEAPWPVEVEVPMVGVEQCDWQKLGGGESTDAAEQFLGTLAGGEQSWGVELRPYDLQAWRFEDEELRIGELRIDLTDVAHRDLEQRIQAIESRSGNLNIERPYARLQNPGFELEDSGVRIVGWQPRMGAVGAVRLEDRTVRSGSRALRLKSEDGLGVAVQSHLFATPETGQLLVSAYFWLEEMEPSARLRIAVQDQDEGTGVSAVYGAGPRAIGRGRLEAFGFCVE